MKKPFGLYSFEVLPDGTRFSGICTRREIVEEGRDIIRERNLPPASFTKEDVRELWGNYHTEGMGKDVVRYVVSSSNWREHYDLRMLCWLYEWYGRMMEVHLGLYEKWPQRSPIPRLLYQMFFTIRGDISFLNLKLTSFYECVVYMRQLEMGKLRRKGLWYGSLSPEEKKEHNRKHHTKRREYYQRESRAASLVRAYMREHPEEVARIKKDHGL